MIRLFFGMGRVAKTPQPDMGDRRFSITEAILPVAHSSGVDVNEVRRRIEPDAADLERLRRIAQVLEVNAGDADVDGLAFDVQAVRGDAAVRAAALLQHR